MNDDQDWQSDAEDKKKCKRKAANDFLKRARDHSDFRDLVLGSEADAQREFKKMCHDAKIEMPDYVRVICVDDERTARNHLVVFALPRASSRLSDDDLWRDGWLAAWDPY